MVKNSFCGPLMAVILKKKAAILNLWVANGFFKGGPWGVFVPILVLVSPFERFHNNAIYVFYLVFTL